MKTIGDYLSRLPEDRREALGVVLNVIRGNLPEGYEEAITQGAVTYQVPLAVYPDTYNKKPMVYASAASQKNYMVVYMMGLYVFPDLKDTFVADYKKTGKRLDLGACCVRFRTLDDLPLDLLGKAIAAIPMEKYIAQVRSVHGK